MRFGIRRFLFGSLLALITVSGAIVASINYQQSSEQVEELFDAEMAQMARLLQSLLSSQLNDPQLANLDTPLLYEDYAPEPIFEEQEYTEFGHKYEKKLAFQVWDHDGRLLIQTRNASEQDFPQMSIGYHDVSMDDTQWRIFTLSDQAQGLTIQVAQREDVRIELTRRIGAYSVIPPLLSIPVLGLIIWWITGASLAPLKNISDQLRVRDYSNLSPLSEDRPPYELKTLIDAINDLFRRVREVAQREQRFTADAAHELRTPLAGTRIQLQNALRATDPNRMRTAMKKSLTGVDRLVQLVQQLLQLSRLDHETALNERVDVEPQTLIRELAAELQASINKSGLNITISQSSPTVRLSGNTELLRILFRNLLDNAIRYSPEGGSVDIDIQSGCIRIRDQGPGVPETELASIFDRFYRASETRVAGNGLGLAISRQIADLHHLHHMELTASNRTDIHGLAVELRWSSQR